MEPENNIETSSSREIPFQVKNLPNNTVEIINSSEKYRPTRHVKREKGGRRSKINSTLINKVFYLAKKGNFEDNIRASLGINYESWRRWMKDGADISQEVDDLLSELEENGEDTPDMDTDEGRKEAMRLLGRPQQHVLYYDLFEALDQAKGQARVNLHNYVAKVAEDDISTAKWLLGVIDKQYAPSNKVEISSNQNVTINTKDQSEESSKRAREYLIQFLMEEEAKALPEPNREVLE